jgi:hypothetical protein
MVSTTHPSPAPEEIKEEQSEENVEGTSAETATSPPAKDKIDTPTSLTGPSERSFQPQEESKNWLELPMLVKLDSMHLLTEWQCQNPQRLRTIMKNDDEVALWVSNRCLGTRFSIRVYIFASTVLNSPLAENRTGWI